MLTPFRNERRDAHRFLPKAQSDVHVLELDLCPASSRPMDKLYFKVTGAPVLILTPNCTAVVSKQEANVTRRVSLERFANADSPARSFCRLVDASDGVLEQRWTGG
jgi:hypothetical protein